MSGEEERRGEERRGEGASSGLLTLLSHSAAVRSKPRMEFGPDQSHSNNGEITSLLSTPTRLVAVAGEYKLLLVLLLLVGLLGVGSL